MITQSTRPSLKTLVAEVLANADSHDTFTVAEMRDQVNALLFARNVNSYNSGGGAIAATLDRLWERDEFPIGWVFDRTCTPKRVRHAGITDHAKLRQAEGLDSPAAIEALIDTSSLLVMSVQPEAVAAFRANPHLADNTGWVVAWVRPTTDGKYEVI